MRRALFITALLAFSAFVGSALAGSFDVSPRLYASLINRTLEHVGSDLRFHLDRCDTGTVIECRFSSERVTALVRGQTAPPRIGSIVIEADLLKDRPGTDPLTSVADCVMALGATMVIFDPGLEAEIRAKLLSDLSVNALDTGRSEGEGVDARYLLTFDEVADGLLRMTVTPAEKVGLDGLADLTVR